MVGTTFLVRRLGPGDEAALAAGSSADARFEHDQDGAVASVPLDAGAAAAFLADPSVLYWSAEEPGGRPLGLLLCYVQRRRAAGAWAELLLHEIGVDVDWRRRGVGRALLGAMEQWMRANGVHEVWVPAASTAVWFYEACGFRVDDGVILAKRLG